MFINYIPSILTYFGLILMHCAQLPYLEIQLVVTKEHKFMVTQCGMDSLLLAWEVASIFGTNMKNCYVQEVNNILRLVKISRLLATTSHCCC